MKIALTQIRMNENINDNLQKSLDYCDKAKESDLLFFLKFNYRLFPHNMKRKMSIAIAKKRIKKNRTSSGKS